MQIVEIYNEQFRELLPTDSPLMQKGFSVPWGLLPSVQMWAKL